MADHLLQECIFLTVGETVPEDQVETTPGVEEETHLGTELLHPRVQVPLEADPGTEVTATHARTQSTMQTSALTVHHQRLQEIPENTARNARNMGTTWIIQVFTSRKTRGAPRLGGA